MGTPRWPTYTDLSISFPDGCLVTSLIEALECRVHEVIASGRQVPVIGQAINSDCSRCLGQCDRPTVGGR